MSESRLWAHVWMALYRPRVQWGGPYPMPAMLLAAQDRGRPG